MPSYKNSRVVLATLFTVAAPFTLSAQSLYWDLNDTAAGAGSATPSGAWDTSSLFWNPNAAGTGTAVAWTDGSAAVFSAGSDATGAFTVNLPAARTASAVTVEEGDITFTGSAITLGAGQLTVNTGARVSINNATQLSSTGGVVLNGGTIRNTNASTDNALPFIPAPTPLIIGPAGGTVNFTPSGTATVSIYSGTITGTGTLTKTGPREFRYQGTGLPNTTYSKLVVNEGLFRLGFNSNTQGERGFGAVPAAFTPDAITLNNGGSIGTSFVATLNANRGITLGAGGGGLTGGSLTIPGAISGAGSLTSTGTATLSGANTYSGGTIVNAGTLSATGTSPLGSTTGTLSVNNLATGAGNTVTLNLSNSAPTVTGSLSGTVATPASGTNVARIVTSGNQLFTVNQTVPGTSAGTITGNGGFTLGTLSTATLTLQGASTYTGGTTVAGGSLSVSGPSAALGTGDVAVASTGTKLTIETGVLNAIADTATFSIAGGGTAGVADTGFVQLGAGVNETVNMLSLGGAFVTAGTYGSSLSAATFKNDEFFGGSGVVTVAVPEPSAAAILFGGLGALIGLQRSRRRS